MHVSMFYFLIAWLVFFVLVMIPIYLGDRFFKLSGDNDQSMLIFALFWPIVIPLLLIVKFVTVVRNLCTTMNTKLTASGAQETRISIQSTNFLSDDFLAEAEREVEEFLSQNTGRQ